MNVTLSSHPTHQRRTKAIGNLLIMGLLAAVLLTQGVHLVKGWMELRHLDAQLDALHARQAVLDDELAQVKAGQLVPVLTDHGTVLRLPDSTCTLAHQPSLREENTADQRDGVGAVATVDNVQAPRVCAST